MLRRIKSLGTRKDDESVVSTATRSERPTMDTLDPSLPLASTAPAEPPKAHANRLELLRPPEKTKIQKFRDFFWDNEKKSCMTRTPINWLSITVYYMIFVAGVLLVFIISMAVALLIAKNKGNRPHYILDESPIGETPSLNFFPLLNHQSLIWLKKNASNSDYVDAINKVFDNYKSKTSKFDPSQFGECASAPFGYTSYAPCIFFRLNRVIMWKPKPYLRGDKLPGELPQSITSEIEKGNQKIWITCNGTTAKDRDHFSSDFFKFQGVPGFDPSAYPYSKQTDFVDPIVALKISDKPSGIVYEFTCTAWGRKMKEKVATVSMAYYFE